MDLDTLVGDLREKVKKRADVMSIALSIAPFFVDSIARINTLFRELDVILFNELCDEVLPFYEKMRRFSSILRMQTKLLNVLLEAVGGLLLCFGGNEVLGSQAVA